MSVVHGPPLGVGGLLRPTTMVLAIAVVAASVGYAVHHVPPAGTHQAFGVFVAVLGLAVF